MRIKKRKADLYLLVNALRAADLVIPGDEKPSKSINAAFVVQLNKYKKRSKRRLNTSQPSWDRQFAVPLKHGDYSQVLVLSVWSKSSREKSYLGELRLCIADLFIDQEAHKTEPQWYKLYSDETEHSYVTGSVLLLFELLAPKQRRMNMSSGSNVSLTKENPKVPSLAVNPPTATQLKLLKLNIKDDTIDEMFKKWICSLVVSSVNPATITPNEQGFYPSDFALADILGASEMSEVESLDDETKVTSKRLSHSEEPLQLLHDAQSKSLFMELGQTKHLDVPGSIDDVRSDVLVSSALSSCSYVSDAYSDGGLYNEGGGEAEPKGRKHRRKRRASEKATRKPKYELRKRDVKGILFVEIISCSDLPPFRNFTRTTFDMDPFIVVTFGKKTFRTSWKRHTLNPVYNERLVFEIMEHELNYNVQFSVLDKDHFSFHDKIADVTLPVQDLMNIALVPTKIAIKEPDDDLSNSELLESKDTDTSHHSNEASGGDEEEFKPSEHLNVKLGNITEGYRNASFSSFGSPSDNLTSNSVIKLAENENLVKVKKRKKLRRSRYTTLYVDTSLFKTIDLSLTLHKTKWAEKYSPTLKLRARYLTYESLRRDFWRILLEQFTVSDTPGTMDYIELMSLLDTLGAEDSDQIVGKFFEKAKKSTWGGDSLDFNEIIDCLEDLVTSESQLPGAKIFVFDRCPICCQEHLSKRDDLDIITHFAICASKDWSIVSKLLVSSYDTPQIATRRWFSKILIKLSYGKYKLGSNSANILVQDRSTGIVMEEKMSVSVRLGIRLLYKGLDKAKSKRIRTLLRKLSIKQGVKFDSPRLKRDIDSFIKFHKLNLADCLITDPSRFETFNDFFYRKLKPGARPIEGDDGIAVSPADCRCTTFTSVDEATELWIKGRNFTLAKLFNGNFNDLEKTSLYNPKECCIGIFRLAPQDYHRFHSPVNGKIGPIKYIEGEYYTVNPMAIRSDLDVYGENVRVVVPIVTETFGTVVLVGVGAMMVGSTIITVKEGQEVQRGDEIGYFKFGGSTVLLLFEKKYLQFDSDIVNNSKLCIETLVRVGQSIGHSPSVKEYKREHIEFDKQPQTFKLNLIRAITGGDVSDPAKIDSWESQNLQITADDMDDLINDPELADYLTDEEGLIDSQ